MGPLENHLNRQEVTMSTLTETIDAERAAARTRLARRQRIVIGLDHIYTVLFYVSVVAAFVAVCIAMLHESSDRSWVLIFAVLCLPHLFDEELTVLMFGEAFDRDHDLLLSLEAEELSTRR